MGCVPKTTNKIKSAKIDEELFIELDWKAHPHFQFLPFPRFARVLLRDVSIFRPFCFFYIICRERRPENFSQYRVNFNWKV